MLYKYICLFLIGISLILQCIEVLFMNCFVPTEDIDPTIGRFRNLVQTQVVPMKVL